MGFFKALSLFVSTYISNPERTVSALKEVRLGEFKEQLTQLVNQANEIHHMLKNAKNVQGAKLELEPLPIPGNRLSELKAAFEEMKKDKPQNQDIGLFVEFMEKGKKSSKSLRGMKAINDFIKRADKGEITII